MMRHLVIFLIISCGVICLFGIQTSYGETDKIVSPEKRRVVIFDATVPEQGEKKGYFLGMRSLQKTINDAGIPSENILILSSVEKTATRENLEKALQANGSKDASDAAEELQVYITAHGVSNGERDMIVPGDVSVQEIQASTDPRLISMHDLQKTLSSNGAGKILLVMNFKSVHQTTRSS